MTSQNKGRILLLGDSIMYGAKGVHGYGWYMKNKLFPSYDVELPLDNCQDSGYLLQFFDDLVQTKNDEFELIIWNNGLWDVLHFAGNPSPYNSLDIYLKNIKSIYELLSEKYPSANICFVNTSYVPEHLQRTSSYRKNTEITEYNKAVTELFENTNVRIIDMFSFVKGLDDDYRQKDGLHFSEEGSEKIADYILSDIKNQVMLD